MNRTLIRSLAVGVLVLGVMSSASAQPPDVSDKPRKQKKEPNTAIKDWIAKDVPYIATKAEKDAFDLLTTDEERENFIATFWRIRDPNPDTEENEYRLEYYERIAYANENFTSGKPGWMTDRGRIYITWGKPDSVESRPAGGSYDRPAWEGGGTTSTYPFEIWFYRGRDGLPNGVEFEFVDPTGSGEYRLTTNPNDKDALLFVPGAGQTDRERLGLETRAERIAGINSRNYFREQDSPFVKAENIQRAFTAPPVNGVRGTGTIEDSPIFDNNPLDFDMRIDFFRQSDDRVVATFSVLTPNKELVFEEIGGVPTARLNIFGKIVSVSERDAGTFQDSVTASSDDAAQITQQSSIYQNSRSLPPGRYKVRVTVTDLSSGNRGTRSLGFEVPDYGKGGLSTSTLVLASTIRDAVDSDIGHRFVIGGKKIIPNLSGTFRKGQDVGVYLQIYNSKIDQTTLRPAVDVEYRITSGSKVVRQVKEDWSALSETGSRLTLARTFATADLDPGTYEVVVKVIDSVGDKPESVEQRTSFVIRE